MKRLSISFKIMLVALLILVVGTQQSCTKLEEPVYSELTGDKFFENPDNLIYAFGVAYTNLYQLMGHKYGIGFDAGTDILVVPQRGGDWFDGGEWIRWHRLEYRPSEAYVSRWWNIIYYGINTCNRLIFQFEALEEVDVTPAVSELRALRALYYYWLVDIYGNVPIQTDFNVPPDFKPSTKTRQEVYDFIEAELKEVMPHLSKETGLAYFGRMNYYAAQMVLAKLYLNAEVYTGVPQWEKASKACDSVMTGNFSLTGNFFTNFEEDATTSPEYILGIAFDQVNAPAFEVHLFTLHYNLSSKYQFEDNCWNGLSIQESLYNSFEEQDVRRNGLLAGFQYFDDGTPVEDPSYEQFNPNDPTAPIDPDGAPLNLTPEINMLEPNCLRQAGTRVAKFPFIVGSDRYTSNDFPIFRYADVLLMKAEALMRSGGDIGLALSLVNQVRARANATPLTELTYENLLAERGRELYAEGFRRSDMIRFGVLLNTRWEKPEVSPSYVTLWPIPESQIQANPNLIQNPGY
ncbi:MAG: RagB/SusD family nutrient uptake outer membrane protein [Bacteroidetes bacterium]|nr:MAG: RagB/SusD family nutrient uptake outer membrane protein [Bacteroidota bacterium]RLD47768.1 MAG: RagB/SusD family nutrient uptake outer membrane protein [Bacteroidota bacterium]RLD73602.1 MAG: RagB/SusD family nutrient uptake outer membrane protein [Bacteroidota bacterium]RLD89911.1 MAG: RagB/SusD family nutrient uptake outer membrane protein [Bacteroidota bacterium]